MHGLMDGWVDEWVGGWMDEWTDIFDFDRDTLVVNQLSPVRVLLGLISLQK